MHRTNLGSGSAQRWENYEHMPVSGSLILTSNPSSPKNYNNQLKGKYD
jgi:hypothetical protein